MIPVKGVSGARIAVLGLGRSGLSAMRSLKAGGADVLCWDDSEEARATADGEGATLHDPSVPGAWNGVAELVLSPGIPHLYPRPNSHVAAAMAAGIPVDNDVGLLFRSLAIPGRTAHRKFPRIVAVTGSNGKSTTAALIHHCLVAIGRESQLAGNIGRGVLDIESPGTDGTIVLELSSYQVELARTLAPDVAVFTNFGPDHLDRHGGLGGYFAAKQRLFLEGRPRVAVIGIDETEGTFLANRLAGESRDNQVIRVSADANLASTGWSVTARDGTLTELQDGQPTASFDLGEMQGLPGVHNHQNACAAFAVLRVLEVSSTAIEEGMRRFEGLPHRGQVVARWKGVTFVNDSKATNADAAARSLALFPRVRWIVGGQLKDGGISALRSSLDPVVKAYAIGCQAMQVARDLDGIEVEVCSDMATAVRRAAKDSEPGDTVLLAPAAASFDAYESFEERGEDFMAEVRKATH
ncbi:MAG: UDP-N-acetylmuramoyl-L-alanine--D-glutamate ligase [Boseongicola sp. SB0677_bin_26]|nr:UDP-N-acetylmuramoyl-L-alanine--D-glutamate ligase [Boseongicola sp. SB0665_bin_10]MYG26286.1 UDP-N-acetylmuramoyl-L-alanine--D-glutamate ligase [Boseongicola sp. SB0677_bin_26]